jgi:hypothetical protein
LLDYCATQEEAIITYLARKMSLYIHSNAGYCNQQPRTPIQTDNTTAEGVINSKIQPIRTKAMDMRFHWLHNQEAQGQFKIYWRPGWTNLSDYFTKHHPLAQHVNVRGKFLTGVKDLAEARCTKIERQTKTLSSKPEKLQGCVSLARL